MNTYAYVGANPLGGIDPWGLMGGGMGSITPSPSQPGNDNCQDDCPNPVTITWTSGLPGARIRPDVTKTYSGECLLKFGIGFKGTSMAAGTAAGSYGPGLLERYGLSRTASVARRIASVASSFPGWVVSLTWATAEILDHCECESSAK